MPAKSPLKDKRIAPISCALEITMVLDDSTGRRSFKGNNFVICFAESLNDGVRDAVVDRKPQGQ